MNSVLFTGVILELLRTIVARLEGLPRPGATRPADYDALAAAVWSGRVGAIRKPA